MRWCRQGSLGMALLGLVAWAEAASANTIAIDQKSPLLAQGEPEAVAPPGAVSKPPVEVLPPEPWSRPKDVGDWYPLALRRKNQRQTTPGHILTPAAANIPGLGFTYGIIGSAFNINESEMDLLGFRFWGDLSGIGAGILDLPVWGDNFTLNLFFNNFTKAAIEQNRRGIKSNHKDRRILELDTVGVYVAQFNLRLFERRLNFNVGMNRQRSSLAAIRDKEGDLISNGSSETIQVTNRSAGMILDLSDDRSDPRRGAQLEIYRYDKAQTRKEEADFYQLEYNLLYFYPLGEHSTWAFNVYRSDAIVQRPGDTDEASVRGRLPFQCEAIPDATQKAQCEKTQKEFVDETLAANRNGTSAALGGTQRLRSYVTNRFTGAHTLFFGSEVRWNLTEEFTPFNIFVASGVRTGVQVAFFGEGGTVAETAEGLMHNYKYSVGTGVRFILASGFVVRLDLANGDEGTQPTLIFQYPWSVF